MRSSEPICLNPPERPGVGQGTIAQQLLDCHFHDQGTHVAPPPVEAGRSHARAFCDVGHADSRMSPLDHERRSRFKNVLKRALDFFVGTFDRRGAPAETCVALRWPQTQPRRGLSL